MSDSGTVTLEAGVSRVRRLRRSVLTSARYLHEEVSAGGIRYRPAMLTLTYRDLDGWKPRHVSECIKAVREWLRRKGYPLRYVWVGELQARGALHYHLVVWLPFRMPMPDQRGWWRHGSTRVEWARNAVGYLAKYVSKCDGSMPFPRGCRIYGAGGLSSVARRCRRWWMLSRELRLAVLPSHDARRAPGGGWVSYATGEWWRSLWAVRSTGKGRVTLIRSGAEPPSLLPLPLTLLEARELALHRSGQQ